MCAMAATIERPRAVLPPALDSYDRAIAGLEPGVMAEGVRRWMRIHIIGDGAPVWLLNLDVIYRVRGNANLGTIRFGGHARRCLPGGRTSEAANKLFFSGTVDRIFDPGAGEYRGIAACEAYLASIARSCR
jgi:hypothetical protein